MSISELQELMWAELPFIRKNLVGRDRVDDLVLVAIEQFPLQYADHVAVGSAEADVFTMAWSGNVKRGYCLLYGEDYEFGPIFWLLISPILQILLKQLLEWWWAGPANRVLMAGWRRELCHD